MRAAPRGLYSLVVSQLLDDGHYEAAAAVSHSTRVPLPPTLAATDEQPHHELLKLYQTEMLSRAPLALDLDDSAAANTPLSEQWSAPHAGCAARFSPDGELLAIGGDDGSVQLLGREALIRQGALASAQLFGDHAGPVKDLDFHPNGSFFVVAYGAPTMRYYQCGGAAAGRHSNRQCTDTHAVSSVSFHPGGQHLLAGTSHPAIHLYDVSSFRCYLSTDAHHRHPLTEARWNADGSMFASCAGGEVKLWDGRSCKCVRSLEKPHEGTAVGSVQFGGGGRYLLSSGNDGTVRLWDVGSGMELRSYGGVSRPSGRRASCCFSHDEASVLATDDDGTVFVWDARSSELQQQLGGASAPIHCLAYSPSYAGVIGLAANASVLYWSAPERG